MIRNLPRPRVLAASLGALVLMVVSMGTAVAQEDEGINISGSSTVEPISSLIGELYGEENPGVPVRVDGPGTGDGFVLFCQGETDISDASRPIKDEGEEAPKCEENGITYTELPVALDGLTVIVNKKSSLGIKCLSPTDLYALFGPESTGSLADASALAEEIAGETNLPTKGTAKKFTPGPESGTYDSFIELGYEDIMAERLEAGAITDVVTNDDGEDEPAEPLISDGQFPNDNNIVKRIAKSKNGIGFLGFAYYLENTDQLKAVPIEDPDTGDCVRPSVKTVQNGSYLPLSRTLFIYVNNEKAEDNADLADFVDFYMSEENLTTSVEQAGYAPLGDEERQAAIDTWDSAAP